MRSPKISVIMFCNVAGALASPNGITPPPVARRLANQPPRPSDMEPCEGPDSSGNIINEVRPSNYMRQIYCTWRPVARPRPRPRSRPAFRISTHFFTSPAVAQMLGVCFQRIKKWFSLGAIGFFLCNMGTNQRCSYCVTHVHTELLGPSVLRLQCRRHGTSSSAGSVGGDVDDN
ncbi:hypothetical protein FN846DRAFT_392280 [Sphaerosporella brunnea]|uniref:Secreted protein n=1 Tax=Sphaerosporella brunnea TaxID=1250544 RepID=A0A5J5F5P8_9PEZI|nr:hypothetical protein FN846DRAFT_392280 [Sphaerosporella brunnea]